MGGLYRAVYGQAGTPNLDVQTRNERLPAVGLQVDGPVRGAVGGITAWPDGNPCRHATARKPCRSVVVGETALNGVLRTNGSARGRAWQRGDESAIFGGRWRRFNNR